MNETFNGALVAMVFGIFGFFLAFSLKRATNIIIFGVFTFASFHALDYLGSTVDWSLFHQAVDILPKLGKTLLDLVAKTLETATFISVICFLSGGLFGFLLKR